MYKKLGCALLCFGSLIATASYSMPTATGLSLTIKLPPNVRVPKANPTMFPINAVCKIQTQDASNEVYAYMKQKGGKFNGTHVSKGEHITVTVKSGDQLRIYAEPSAEVELTNLGQHEIIAKCSTV